MILSAAKVSINRLFRPKKAIRLGGFGPPTYGLEIRKLENVTDSISSSYKSSQNQLIVNSTENPTEIQQDLAKIINRWPCLSENVRHAILILIEEN